MKIFLSGNSYQNIDSIKKYCTDNSKKIPYYLYTFFYHTDSKMLNVFNFSEEILVDSGAHSFQIQSKKKNKTANYDEYLKNYIEFIKKYDRKEIIGYFELDVDHDIGYAKVKEYRKQLEAISPTVKKKIIPVWHKNRGIEDFIQMCKERPGQIVAISGFKNEDIYDEQFDLFLRVANKYNAKLHVLGLTRFDMMEKHEFYSVDSSTWTSPIRWGDLMEVEYRDGIPRLVKIDGKLKLGRVTAESAMLKALDVWLVLVNFYKNRKIESLKPSSLKNKNKEDI